MNDSNTINKGSLPGLKEKRYLQKKAIIGFLYRMGELSKPEIFNNIAITIIFSIVCTNIYLFAHVISLPFIVTLYFHHFSICSAL